MKFERGKRGFVVGNKYVIHDDYAEGFTTKGESFYLDIEDVELAKKFTWRIDHEGYLASGGKTINGKRENTHKLHREVMGLKSNDGKIVDHIDRNRSDNRKSNLRLVTIQENAFNQGASKQNKSGVVGVFYRERKGKKPKWIASINIDGKTRQIGHFNTMEEAIKARKEAEIKYYGGLRYE